MSASPIDANDDPAAREQATRDAAGYLIEMLGSLSHFAHRADLSNSAVMLAAAAQVIEQECRHLTRQPPNSDPHMDPSDLFPFFPDGRPRRRGVRGD